MTNTSPAQSPVTTGNYGQGLNYGHHVHLYRWTDDRRLEEVYVSPELNRNLGLFAIADECKRIAAGFKVDAYRLHRHGQPRGCMMMLRCWAEREQVA